MDREEIIKEFDIDESLLEGCKVIYAEYDTPSYEGYCLVLFEKDDKLFEVYGSHCSCYGLEGQWSPEETNLETIKHKLSKADSGWYGVEKGAIGTAVKEWESATGQEGKPE